MRKTLENYAQILLSYWKDTSFLTYSLILVIGFLNVDALKRIFDSYHDGIGLLILIIPAFFFIFIGLIGWPLLFGMILKSQFAHSRAVTFPGFRYRNLIVALMMFMCHAMIVFMFVMKFMNYFFAGSDSIAISMILGLWCILCVWGGYLLHFGAYSLLLLPGLLYNNPSFDQTGHYFTKQWAFISLFPLAVGLLVLLGMRLWKVREEMWEYGWIYDKNNLSKSPVYKGEGRVKWTARLLYRTPKIKIYPEKADLLVRAGFWLHSFYARRSFTIILVMVGLTILNFWRIDADYLEKTFSKLSLPIYMLFPFLVTSFGNFSTHFTSALLKPITRKRLILELGIADLLSSLLLYMMFIMSMGVSIIAHNPAFLFTKIFWLNILVTLSIGISFFGLSGIAGRFGNTAKGQLGPSLALMVIAVFILDWVQHLAFQNAPYVITGFFLAGVVAIKLAYELWCQAEVKE